MRDEIVYKRTYSRPKDDGTFETWEDTIAQGYPTSRMVMDKS